MKIPRFLHYLSLVLLFLGIISGGYGVIALTGSLCDSSYFLTVIDTSDTERDVIDGETVKFKSLSPDQKEAFNKAVKEGAVRVDKDLFGDVDGVVYKNKRYFVNITVGDCGTSGGIPLYLGFIISFVGVTLRVVSQSLKSGS